MAIETKETILFQNQNDSTTKVEVTLQIESSHGADHGNIICVAENIVGKAKNITKLIIFCMYC